jgi:hypothetical protein
MGTFRRTERAFWFLFGTLTGGLIVAVFITIFDVLVRPKK